MHSAFVNIPSNASAIVTTEEVVKAILPLEVPQIGV
jgi:hypothetical protein